MAELQLGDMVGPPECGLGRGGIALLDLMDQVGAKLFMQDRGIRIERLGGVGQSRQRRVVDLDRLGGIQRLISGFGDHHGDGVAHMPDLAAGEDRP